MHIKSLRMVIIFFTIFASISTALANNISLDSDNYTYDSVTNQLIVKISYDFTDFAMLGGGFGLMYDAEALTFVSYTRDLSNSQAQPKFSPTGLLVSPGFYGGAGIGRFEIGDDGNILSLTDAATFGTFVFDVEQPTCTICFLLTPNIPNNPMISAMGQDVTAEIFANGITEATIEFPDAEDRFQFADECVYLMDDETNRYVRFSDFRYQVTQLIEEATPFYMKATTLGNYMLYGPDERMISVNQAGDRIIPARAANQRAEWSVSSGFVDGPLRVLNNFSGFELTVGDDDRLTQFDGKARRWKFPPATDCEAFPEVELNVQGDPQPSQDPELPVTGFVDAHSHITAFDFIGGRLHCAKPWDRYGVTQALVDCPDHFATGAYAILENLFTNGSREGFHLDQDWPIFDPPDLQGWPRYDSLTHESMYWKAIERVWKSGMRLMVTNLTENKPVCELYWLGDNSCDDRESIANQAQKLRDLEEYIDAQYKGPGNGFFRIVESPSEARNVINEGKLAVVLGVETTRPMSCAFVNADPTQCGADTLDDRLTELWDLGVRSMFPVYNIDNAFGGTSMAADFQGILYNYANQAETGGFWKVEACTGDEADITPPSPSNNSILFPNNPNNPSFQAHQLEMGTTAATPEPPTYPTGPVCNTRGLTEQGALLINRMADMGMIIETDNMSAKTRDQVLTILEERNYSGVTTSHSTGGSSSRVRIQALGGFVAPHSADAVEFVAAWQNARDTQSPDFSWGIGFGSDANGLRQQAGPRPGADVDNPVLYPFDSFDESVMMEQNVWGNRIWDINQDGVAHYGMYPDWIRDLENIAGSEIIEDLASGAEVYLQMWERAFPDSQ